MTFRGCASYDGCGCGGTAGLHELFALLGALIGSHVLRMLFCALGTITSGNGKARCRCEQ
ncbi:MAG: hypothetical protein ACJ8EL_03700 [Rhizomicrobium sp.]|jgi:hypothetical protein